MKYLKIFVDFLDVAEHLSDGAMGRLFRAMLAYARDEAEPELRGKEAVAWTVAKQHIDREREAYEGKVSSMERAREHRKQAGIRQRPVSASQISREDKEKDNDKDKYKDKDKDIYIGPQGPAPKAHIYIHPPSLEEIEAFCRERGNSVDPAYFYNYYRSNGWRVGKNPMKDWKAAICAWEGNGMGDKQAPVKEPMTDRELFQQAIELHRMKGAKQV